MSSNIFSGLFIKVTDKELLKFFLPDFIEREILFFNHEDKVICTNPQYSREVLEKNTLDFVSIRADAETNIDDKRVLFDLVSKKWNEEHSKSFLDALFSLDDNDIIRRIKEFWVLGYIKDFTPSMVENVRIHRLVSRTEGEIVEIITSLFRDGLVRLFDYNLYLFFNRLIRFNPDYKNSEVLKKARGKFSQEQIYGLLRKYRLLNRPILLKMLWIALEIKNIVDCEEECKC
jgi:hypothetical protein